MEEFIEKEKASRPKKETGKRTSAAEKEKKGLSSLDVDDMFAHALARSYGTDKKD